MDSTENIRRGMVQELNTNAGEREALEKKYGQVWSTDELSKDFEALGFMAPFIIVRRNADGKRGTLMFQHSPRFYFSFTEE